MDMYMSCFLQEINDELAINCVSRANYAIGAALMVFFPLTLKEQTFFYFNTVGADLGRLPPGDQEWMDPTTTILDSV